MHKHGLQEPKKVAIQESRLYALLGTIIHLIPVAGVAVVVTLNIKGHLFGFFVVDYLDSSSNWLPVLFIAAKLHDLFMLASLTSFVFSVMCSELCCRDGLPYGAVFSGFQIRQPSIMWSQETWGLLKSNETPRLHRAKLALVIFGAGILAVAVGPASGGLMVPRLKLSDVGSTPFWLNATDSNLFPSTLNDTLVRSSCANISGQPSLNSCPSSGWEALAGFASLSRAAGLQGPPGSNWNGDSVDNFINSSSSDNVIDLLGSYATRSMYRTWFNDEASPLMTTQHAALAEALFVISQMWNLITQSTTNAYLAGASSHTLSAWQPYSAVFCSSNYTIDNASDTRPIPFVHPYGSTYGSDLMTTNRSGLLQTQENETKPSLLFLDLKSLHWSDPFLNDITVGAVISESNTSFSTCIVHAGWASTYLNLSTGSVESPSNISTLFNRTIEISPSWAEYLNPVTDSSGNRVFASLSSFFNGDLNQRLAQMDPGDQTRFQLRYAYESILAALVTNGLANVYIDSTLQGDLVVAALCAVTDPDEPCDWSKLYSSDPAYFKTPSEAKPLGWNEWQVKHSVQGLAYSSEGIVIKFYIVVLLVYAAIVVLYSLYSLVMGRTSSPWRSVWELTTLALVSPQPDKGLNEFHSTSTGIYGLGVFEKNVRVVAVDEGQGAENGREELQLVFGKKMPLGYKKVVPNDEYGASL